jgi:hypothetical protein
VFYYYMHRNFVPTQSKFPFCDCSFCIQQIGSPSGNSYFLLSSPGPSGSPPKEAAPSISSQAPQQENTSPVGQPRDFFRDAINTSGIGYGMRDDNLADIYPQQVTEVDILSLGLPRLSTGRKLYMLHLYCSILLWIWLPRTINI